MIKRPLQGGTTGQRLPGWCSTIRRPSREQILCAAAAGILAFASYFVAYDSSFLQSGRYIERGAPGSADRQYELNVKEEDGSSEVLKFKVSAREFTEEEARETIRSLIEELSVHITADNADLLHVYSDLALRKTIPGFDGVRLSWYPEDPALISYDGKLNNLELEEAKETSIRVVLKAGTVREEYALPVTVFPARIDSSEDIWKKLVYLVEEADKDQLEKNCLSLPEEVDGRKITYEVLPNTGWMKILGLGVFAFILFGLKPEQDRRQELKKRENELLTDYSDLVSKLVIYMGAGMTARNAWIRIAENYADALECGNSEKRTVYEEMQRSAGELKKGVSESRVFTEFANRCSLNCYLKLVSILEQNRKTGDARSENALLLEAQDAFEQRKNIARRLGEEAGTKLMLPLITSLITVMLIVAVPAMLTLA